VYYALMGSTGFTIKTHCGYTQKALCKKSFIVTRLVKEQARCRGALSHGNV